jgi:hypothetical protein
VFQIISHSNLQEKIYKENTNTMKTKNQIRINGTDVIIGPKDLYYLSYPIDLTLSEFLIRDVLSYNFSKDTTSSPFSCFIGDHAILNRINKTLHDVPSGAIGNFCYLSETTTWVLKELMYQQLVRHNPSFVLLFGFNSIRFDEESELKRSEDLDFMLDDLRKFQNEFNVPILLAGTTNIKYGDENRLIPALSKKWPEVEVNTSACFRIKAKLGDLKLFHIPQANPGPVRSAEYPKIYNDL